MKKIINILFFIFISFSSMSCTDVFAEVYNATVLEVIDGDTLDLRIDVGLGVSVTDRVRVYGVDTPESRTLNLLEKKRGLEVKEFVKKSMPVGMKIKVDVLERDKFGRYLTKIYIEGWEHDLSSELISRGMAKEYYGEKKSKWEF